MVDWAHLFVLFSSLDFTKIKEIKKVSNYKNTKTKRTRDGPSANKSFQWVYRRQKVEWWNNLKNWLEKKSQPRIFWFSTLRSTYIYNKNVLIMGAERNANALNLTCINESINV